MKQFDRGNLVNSGTRIGSGNLWLERLNISYNELTGEFKYEWQVGWPEGYHSGGAGGTVDIPQIFIKNKQYQKIANMINSTLNFGYNIVTVNDIKPIITSYLK